MKEKSCLDCSKGIKVKFIIIQINLYIKIL